MGRTKINELAEMLFHRYATDWVGDEWNESQQGSWEEINHSKWIEDANDVIALLKDKKFKEVSEPSGSDKEASK